MRAEPEKVGVSGGRRAARWLWPVLLALIGASYYALYFRSGFNLADEGSVAFLSQRILQGERPIADLMLGYNVMWFYPIAGLFALFGVNLVAMRVYFFALALLGALLGFGLVRGVTRSDAWAFGAGLILVVIPSTFYRVYIPLLVIANTGCLLLLIRAGPRLKSTWLRCALGGAVLGLTFLIRVDLGIFFTAMWLGVSALALFSPGVRFGKKLAALVPGVALVLAVALVVHAPVYLDAKRRGFDREFIGQYGGFFWYLVHSILPPAERPRIAPEARDAAVALRGAGETDAFAEPARIETSPAPPADVSREILSRKPPTEIWKAKKNVRKAFAFLTYAPLLSIGAMLAWSLLPLSAREGRRSSASARALLRAFLHRWTTARARERVVRAHRSDAASAGKQGWKVDAPAAFTRWLSLLALSGGALTAYPQFFGFRPDVSHLSEFMSGFVLAAACAAFFACGEIRRAPFWKKLPAAALVCLLALHIAVWIAFALPQRSAGTIVARFGRTTLFRAENGVNVYLSPTEFAGCTAIKDALLTHSKPGEYVVCYPYSPGVNFMTNRPTFERSLYVDNATRPSDFDAQTIAKIQAHDPAVIVLSDWPVNRNEASRFSNWAPRTKSYIASHYTLRGTFLKYQVYARQTPAP